MRRRTRARELALQFLYSLEVRGDEAHADLEVFLKDSGASVLIKEYATRLIDGVREHAVVLDERITKHAKNWKLSRIAMLDRNLLRLGAFELIYCLDVPPNVAINEAIELGKRYSTAQTGSFVNGILDQMQQYRDQDNSSC